MIRRRDTARAAKPRSVSQEEHELETPLTDPVLMRLHNLGITPHSAFYTRRAVARMLGTTVENIQSFIQGEPQKVVDSVT